MTQKAIVKRLLTQSLAQVSLMRQLECGLSCKSCEGCPQKPTDELLATADNTVVQAQPGDVVEVRSNTASVYAAVFYAFILPCVGLIVAYLLAAYMGVHQLSCILISFSGALIFFVPAILFNRSQKRTKQAEFTIVCKLR